MNEINKTLYIPLFGKAKVSRQNIILQDRKAEEIWEQIQFPLKGKSKSKWLAYFMAMRAKVFDDWTCMQLKKKPDAIVLHIGCGLDSRCLRLEKEMRSWYDVDFPEVIEERKKYYQENEHYHMIGANAVETKWLELVPESEHAIVIMEGVSMYLSSREAAHLFDEFDKKFQNVHILMDVYTTFAAKASKYKNPINEVGVTTVHGIDDPRMILRNNQIQFIEEHTMTPDNLVDQLVGFEHFFFQSMFTGNLTKKIYRLFEYSSN